MSPREMFATDDELIGELEAMAPRPAPEFAARLDALAAAGFPEQPAPAPRGRRRGRSWWLSLSLSRRQPLVAGSVVCALVAAVVTVGVVTSGGGREEPGGGASTGAAAVADESVPPSAGATASGTSAGAADSFASATPNRATAPSAPRKVERSAQMAVTVAEGRFADAAARVSQIAAGVQAIVDTSQLSTGRGRDRAAYTLRVPVGRLDAALGQLAELGTVVSRDESGDDITGAVVSAEDLLGDLRAERDSLRRRLAATDDDARAGRLRQELAELRERIAQARGDAMRLQQRARYATVDLTLTTRGAASASEDDDQGAIAGALDDAGRILGAIAATGIVVLAVAAPLALVLALLWCAARVLRRRRREAGLV